MHHHKTKVNEVDGLILICIKLNAQQRNEITHKKSDAKIISEIIQLQ